jgi:hypothetical protein
MRCGDKRLIQRKHALYARAYSEAVVQLIAVSSLATRSDWDLAWELASCTQLLCHETLQQLREHTVEHGC